MKKIFAVILLAACFCTNVFAATFVDMPDNWSTTALEKAVANGLIAGVGDGYIMPDKSLTRAEMATIVVRAFGAVTQGDISGFKDVSEDKWYYPEMAKAYAMGIFKGDANSNMNPENFITRQEAFTVLARAFSVSANNIESVNKFPDAGDISSWALDSVAGLIERGYINGSNGYIKPLDNITRAEFAQIMYNLVKTYLGGGLAVSGELNGNVIVRKSIALKNMTINGDLIIADGVEGYLALENVTVNGRLVVRSGSEITLEGSYDEVVVVGNNITVTALGSTTIKKATVTGENSLVENEDEVISVPDPDNGSDTGDNDDSSNSGNTGNTGDNDDSANTNNPDVKVEKDDAGWSGWY